MSSFDLFEHQQRGSALFLSTPGAENQVQPQASQYCPHLKDSLVDVEV